MTAISPLDLVARAFATTQSAVDAAERAQLSLARPCTDWDVRTLVNHIIGGAEWYAEAMREGVTSAIDAEDDDYVAGDFHAAYANEIRRALDAFGAPGALEREIQFVGRPMPATTVARLCALDTFAHGWDLSRALGRSTDLDPELAESLLEHAVPRLPVSFRGTGPDALYRPPTDAPLGATAADRFAAALGRAVRQD